MPPTPRGDQNDRRNRFASHPRFAKRLEVCEPDSGEILIEADQRISHVYFPETAVVSLVVPIDKQKCIEVAIVGKEGIVGLPVALNDHHHIRAIVQIPGRLFRLDANLFRKALKEDDALDRGVRHYTLARIHQLAQSAACNQAHSVQQRICRWLLMCHDRVETDQFPLTHQFLAQMLCVRRPTVSDAAARLQLDGLISYKRGRITIRNRGQLEKRSCSCYNVLSKEMSRLLQ